MLILGILLAIHSTTPDLEAVVRPPSSYRPLCLAWALHTIFHRHTFTALDTDICFCKPDVLTHFVNIPASGYQRRWLIPNHPQPHPCSQDAQPCRKWIPIASCTRASIAALPIARPDERSAAPLCARFFLSGRAYGSVA